MVTRSGWCTARWMMSRETWASRDFDEVVVEGFEGLMFREIGGTCNGQAIYGDVHGPTLNVSLTESQGRGGVV
jgi:hypothetical protein